MTRFFVFGQPIELYWTFLSVFMLAVAFVVSWYLIDRVFRFTKRAVFSFIGVNLAWFFIPSITDLTIYSGMISELAQMMQVGSLIAAVMLLLAPAVRDA